MTADALDEAARAGRFATILIAATPEGTWQASLQARRGVNSYRVEIRPTPSAALAAVLGAPLPPVDSGVFG